MGSVPVQVSGLPALLQPLQQPQDLCTQHSVHSLWGSCSLLCASSLDSFFRCFAFALKHKFCKQQWCVPLSPREHYSPHVINHCCSYTLKCSITAAAARYKQGGSYQCGILALSTPVAPPHQQQPPHQPYRLPQRICEWLRAE